MTEDLLTCPIRGKLNASSLAKDGLTVSEEARRIDFLTFLLHRGYPKDQIDTEVVVLKDLGESGKNKLRADVIVYTEPVKHIRSLPKGERLKRALLVAEIKRDSTKKKSGIDCQLKPAMAQLPGLIAVWACEVKGSKRQSYVGQINLALTEHRNWFESSPVVVAGDFNSNARWDKERRNWNHSTMVDELRKQNIVSVYHTLKKEAHGEERTPTFHFTERRK